MVVNAYIQRDRATDREHAKDRAIVRENVKEKSLLLSVDAEGNSFLKEIVYPYLRLDGSARIGGGKNPPSHPLLHIFVEWENLSQLTHLHWAMMDSK